jgi:hypothetical protein
MLRSEKSPYAEGIVPSKRLSARSSSIRGAFLRLGRVPLKRFEVTTNAFRFCIDSIDSGIVPDRKFSPISIHSISM